MKTFFQELFQYNHRCNQEVMAAMTFSQPNSIRLISHILNAHQNYNSKIQSAVPAYKSWDLHSIEELKEIDLENYEQSLQILDTFKLDQMIDYVTGKGQHYNLSVRDLLFQVITHSTYHRAQIATDFRQSGVEPLMTDYIYYKMK